MQSLNGMWKLAQDANNCGRDEQWYTTVRSDAVDASVPGTVQETFPNACGLFWYWRKFRLDRAPKPRERCLLKFSAVDYIADVYVNGRHVASHEGGETPFVVDVTAAVYASKDNLLAVRVHVPGDTVIDGISLAVIPHRHRQQAEFAPGRAMNSGGIYGRVDVTIVPPVRISDVFVRPDRHTGDIRMTVTVLNTLSQAVSGTLNASVGESPSGEIIHSVALSAAFASGESRHEMTLHVAQPKLWDINDPNLYRVTTTLTDAKRTYLHESAVRCGFREFRVEKGYFRLNGRRILLKSTHTCNHFPIGICRPVDPDLLRRDMLMAKVAGYNCVRFIAAVALPEQLEIADEIGLMVYEENLAGWCLGASNEMKQRFDSATREMILRDRNHPSVTIWGLLNETSAGPVFDAAVGALAWLRDIDETRLVLLSSGRWDFRMDIGSLSNPGSRTWQCQWGGENARNRTLSKYSNELMGYVFDAGDAHIYPSFPHTPSVLKQLEDLGSKTQPVFLSEYGIGSLLDVMRASRYFEQQNARTDLLDVQWFRSIADLLNADWKEWKFDETYAFVDDMLRDSERLHSRQRRLAFDRIRSNPRICGYNLTGMLDHGIAGEGVWTFFRQWKPESAEVLEDGWAGLRWCLLIDKLHGYCGRSFRLRAVLANEDVLRAGDYPCTFKVHGPGGTIWSKSVTVSIPETQRGVEPPLAIDVLDETVTLKGPAGQYEFVAYMEKGGAPFGGHRSFRIAPILSPQKPAIAISTFGMPPAIGKWLTRQGIRCTPLGHGSACAANVILVGNDRKVSSDSAGWYALVERVARGGYAIFASSHVFSRSNSKPFGPIRFIGTPNISNRCFDVPNVPKDQWRIYSREIWGESRFVIGKLAKGTYRIVLDFCEGFHHCADARVFSIFINGEKVLSDFDIFKEAGGEHLAVQRTFDASTRNGQIEVHLADPKKTPSISRIRVLDGHGKLVAEETASRVCDDQAYWLPLADKGTMVDYFDWLYHKECVAKAHPIFEGLQAKGIMDWDEYDAVISHRFLVTSEKPAEVIAAAFAPGTPCATGYASGLMLAEYRLGAGRFLMNTFNVLENIDAHPAADRMLINMIRHARASAGSKPTALPKDFTSLVRSIGYADAPAACGRKGRHS